MHFIEKNGLEDLMVVKTIIVNTNGEICYYGSPIINENLKTSFLKTIVDILTTIGSN